MSQRRKYIMKIDMHVHCLPISLCAHHAAEEIPEIFLKKGIDAFVLTNHCYPLHLESVSKDLREQAQIYVDIYHRCKAKGDEVGVKVFFGAEIKLINEPHKPEFVLYGLSEQDFIDSHPIYNCTQKELFDFCNEKNIVMVQAHPFRIEQKYEPADMRYVHGVECNSHPSFDGRFDKVIELAKENGKIITAGSDFHFDREDVYGGMIIPDEITDQFMLRDYIRQGKTVLFGRDGITDLSVSE